MIQQPEEEFEEDELELFERHRILVDKGQSLVRIDKFLTEKIAHVTRNKVQQAIDNETVLVNGKPVKANYRIKPLDDICLLYTSPSPRD